MFVNFLISPEKQSLVCWFSPLLCCSLIIFISALFLAFALSLAHKGHLPTPDSSQPQDHPLQNELKTSRLKWPRSTRHRAPNLTDQATSRLVSPLNLFSGWAVHRLTWPPMDFIALGAFCSLGTRRLVNFSWALPVGTVPCLLPDTVQCPSQVPLTASCAHRLPRASLTHWVRQLQFSPVSQHLPTTFPGILVLPLTTFSG